jgi:hypothetical protein
MIQTCLKLSCFLVKSDSVIVQMKKKAVIASVHIKNKAATDSYAAG